MTTVTIPLQWRHGTAAQWTTATPVLLAGEAGYETDTGKFKIGNGSSIWSSLAYQGGSGGAVALASAERVLMLEHAVYSVISPEGCASILWRSNTNAQDAAEAPDLAHQVGGGDVVV